MPYSQRGFYSRGMLAAMLLLWCANTSQATILRFETVMGNFDVRLFDAAMPRTVTNFLHYVTTNKYDGTVVHRNSDTRDTPTGPLRDFVIQGGGFKLADPVPPNTRITQSSVVTIAPIADEPGGGVAGLSNLRGTIAMAKSGPNTVTSQWFINQGNNSTLDSPARADGGFSAFGAVLGSGMTVVDAIGDLPVPADFGFSIGAPFNDLPLRNFSGTTIDHVRVQHTVTVTKVSVRNLPAGDYDFNGTVNAADYSVWKSTFGSRTNASADGNGNGVVDAADYTVWRNTLGTTSAVGAGDGGVPEPASCLLLIPGAMLLSLRRRRR
jgi:peptidyl-prolyl cis-trans isomerase A (cyclophilin A)